MATEQDQDEALRQELLQLQRNNYDAQRRKLFMDAVIARLIEGHTITEICRSHAMPSRNVIARWKADNIDGFRDRYDAALLARAEFMADEMQEIADNGSNDWIERTNKNGDPYTTFNPEAVQRSKLRIDQRQWVISRLLATVYGDKLQVRHAGNAGQELDISKLTSDELRQLREIAMRAKAPQNNA